LGGLSKRVTLVDQLSHTTNAPLVIDSGNLFFKPGISEHTVSSAAQTKATIIAQTFLAGQNAVIAIGSNDLAAGPSFLKKLEKKHSFQFLSANLATAGTDTPLFKPFTTKKTGDLHIAIIGLTGRPLPPSPSAPLSLLSWKKILPKLLERLRTQADMIVLLSNLPPHENIKIAQNFDTINIIFQSGNTTKGNIPPYIINNTLVCQTTTRGRYQGVLEIKWNESRKWQKHATAKMELNHIKAQLEQVNQKILQGEQRQPGEARQGSRLKGLQRLKQRLAGQQDQLQQQVNDSKSSGATYNNRFIALSSQVEDDPQTVKLIRAAKLR
jgi:2',3'-cyclic-nucleotide 2'-phosphodiesterase (5'-nucleotidase family)